MPMARARVLVRLSSQRGRSVAAQVADKERRVGEGVGCRQSKYCSSELTRRTTGYKKDWHGRRIRIRGGGMWEEAVEGRS